MEISDSRKSVSAAPGRAKGKIEEHAKNRMENIAQNSELIIHLCYSETIRYAS